jgi:adenylosuccinate synthase
VALGLLDVLGYLPKIPVCIGYCTPGEITQRFPTTGTLEGATPIYEVLPGWGCDISEVRAYADLPAAAKRYVQRVEELVGVPVRWLSVGPSRAAKIAL